MSTARDYAEILRQVSSWPPDRRLSLAQEILAGVEPRPLPAPRQTADRAYGLLKGPLPAPDDDDVRRMLHEHRMEKYGR